MLYAHVLLIFFFSCCLFFIKIFIVIFFPIHVFKKLDKGFLFIVDKPGNINEPREMKVKPLEILSLKDNCLDAYFV